MRYIFILTIFVSTFLKVSSQPETIWQLLQNGDIIKWAYTGGDEFNDDELDMNKWAHDPGTNVCTKELQYFTEGDNIEFGYNSEINSGTIKLIAKEEQAYERSISWKADDAILECDGVPMGQNKRYFNYTSAHITPKQKFKYGLFEIRCKLPEGKGLWPAFWLYGGNPNEEFDIFEYKGETPNKIHYDMHCPGNDCKYFGDWVTANGNFSDGFNIMMGEWGPNAAFWYLNGNEFAIWLGNLNYQEALIANLSIASDDGLFSPGPDNSTIFPAIFEIDYIRIWSRLDCDQDVTINDYNQTLTDPTIITGNEITIGNSSTNVVLHGPPSNTSPIYGEYLTVIGTERIKINPGFHAEAGSNFLAKTVDCPGPQKSIQNNFSNKGALKIISEDENNNQEKSATIENPPVLYTKIYPNPTNGIVKIEFVGKINKNIKIELINSSGQSVFKKDNITDSILEIDIANLPKGIYYLTGYFGKKAVSEKIILNCQLSRMIG